MTVYSYDVNNSKLIEDKVAKTLNDNHNQTVILIFKDGSTIHASYNHKFYDLDKEEWEIIGDFKAGDRLKTSDGITSTIKSITKDPNNESVYNFETENYHNYFVFSKETNNRYLVHNYK